MPRDPTSYVDRLRVASLGQEVIIHGLREEGELAQSIIFTAFLSLVERNQHECTKDRAREQVTA